MRKFEITEAQIDNSNDIYNRLSKFSGGLNIICGDNEIGKSTLMEFIKNILTGKSDAKGYIKCSSDGREITLRAEENKSKKNGILIPEINPYNYKAGFVINLDDLVFAKKADSENLINILKDSSGNAVNEKEKEYYNYIHDKKQNFPLTATGANSKKFRQQFDNLKNINKKIAEAQAKEEEYTNICSSINQTEKELERLSEQLKSAEILAQKNEILKQKENIKINQKLLDNRSLFENLREEYGSVNSAKQKEPDLISNLEKNKASFYEKLNEINKLESAEREDIQNSNLSSDDLNSSKIFIENKKNFERKKEQLNEKISEIKGKLDRLNLEILSTEHQLKTIGIEEFEEYQKDRDMLSSYKTEYSELTNKTTSEVSGNKQFSKNFFIFIFGFIFSMATMLLIEYWKTPLKIPFGLVIALSLVGLVKSFTEAIPTSKNSEYYQQMEPIANGIIELCQKYKFPLSKNENILIRVGAHIQTMSDKISEYKLVHNDLLKVRIEYEREKDFLKENEDALKKLNKKISENDEKIAEFLSNTFIKNIDNYPEIYGTIKELKTLQQLISNGEKELETITKNTENFTEHLNNFTDLTELTQIHKLNKYEYEQAENILSEIRKILDENISNEKLLSELNSKLSSLNTDSENCIEENMPELSQIKKAYEDKRDEKTKLIQKKETIESLGDLISLKNEKYAELNRLKNGLSKLIQKELIYNIIVKSKEKFNETQPNLVSAKKFIAKITSEKYTKIDFDNRTISGENTPEKDWDKLSRGTKEQLYLALRLGYAFNYSDKNNLALPLIIDDAFVNFDYKRTTAVLKCLKEFSENNQVLYFTCHVKMIKDILDSEDIKYNLIEL